MLMCSLLRNITLQICECIHGILDTDSLQLPTVPTVDRATVDNVEHNYTWEIIHSLYIHGKYVYSTLALRKERVKEETA